MAKLIIQGGFTTVGSYFGGPIGGMVGGFLGSMLAGFLFPEKPVQVGPRLTDLTVTSTAFGEPIRDGHGTMPYPGHLIDSSDLIEGKHKIKAQSGKGMSAGPRQFEYVYSVICAWIFRRREAAGFLRIWLDTKLVRDVTATSSVADTIASNFGWKGGSFTFYLGDEDQLPDPGLESIHGVGNVPAYRGMVSIAANRLQLADFANRIPTISAEIFDEGDAAIELGETFTNSLHPVVGSTNGDRGINWHYVDDNGEMLLMHALSNSGYPARMSTPQVGIYRLTPQGEFWEIKIVVPLIAGFNEDPIAFGWKGVADRPIYAALGSAIHGDVAYHIYDFNIVQDYYYEPVASFGSGGSQRFVLKDVNLYMYSGVTFQIGEWFSTGGAVGIISNALTGKPELADLAASDNYLYGIVSARTGANQIDIYQISRADLTLVNTFTPEIPDFRPGFNETVSISVRSDTEIYISIINFNEGPVNFFRYNSVTGLTESLGGADLGGATITAGLGTKMFYANGVFYFSAQHNYVGAMTQIFMFLLRGSGSPVLLSKIVSDYCRFAGLPQDRFDVTELTDLVSGYERDAQSTAADMIQSLMNAYLFDACESDGKIKFKKRARALSYSIPRGDLAAHEPGETMPEKAPTRQIQERQLPTVLQVKYIMADHDYEQGMQYEERLASDFRNVVEVNTPISMSDNEARQLAGKLMPILWSERNSREIRLTRKYVKLEIGDAFEVTI